jgi:hypothetical protein
MSTKPLGWPWRALSRPVLEVELTTEEERAARAARARAVADLLAAVERDEANTAALSELEQVERARRGGEPC